MDSNHAQHWTECLGTPWNAGGLLEPWVTIRMTDGKTGWSRVAKVWTCQGQSEPIGFGFLDTQNGLAWKLEEDWAVAVAVAVGRRWVGKRLLGKWAGATH